MASREQNYSSKRKSHVMPGEEAKAMKEMSTTSSYHNLLSKGRKSQNRENKTFQKTKHLKHPREYIAGRGTKIAQNGHKVVFERQTLLLVSGVFFYIPCFLETPSSSSFSAAFTLEASIETMSDKRRTKRTENEQNNGIQFSPAFFDCLASKAKAVFFPSSLFFFLY